MADARKDQLYNYLRAKVEAAGEGCEQRLSAWVDATT